MLIHKALKCIGGGFAAAYQTPGCHSWTVASDCLSMAGAEAEVKRLNSEQVSRERAIKKDRQERGLGGAYHALEWM